MENISRIKEKCVGCKSCEQICPKHCISMVESNEGFWYPSVDEKSCIECKLCLKKCPVENTEFHRNNPQKVWAWRNKNDTDIMRSASGGAADSAAKTILQMGGVVYGAAYDEQLVVSHIEVTDEAEREKLQSSKYVQSDLKDSYAKAKQRLFEGKTVLFTGTPCQIAGLYAFLGGDQDRLYTVDLVCHGVPSPRFYEAYLCYQGQKKKEGIEYINFRSKEKWGWGTYYMLKSRTKKETGPLSLDKYGQHFLKGDCYRECCYLCPYANTNRVGDLTVGDFWSIAQVHPDFYSSKGVSLVFVGTQKGQQLFNQMKKYALIESASIEDAIIRQGNLIRPTIRPLSRNNFYNDLYRSNFIEKLSYDFVFMEYIKFIMPKQIKLLLKRVL